MDELERFSLETLVHIRKKQSNEKWTRQQHRLAFGTTGNQVRNIRYDYRETQDKLAERAELKQQIEELAVDGKVAVYTWGRDCDLYESNHMFLIPATVIAFERYEDDMYKNAEGPTIMYPDTMEAFHDFQPTHRDRAAEMMNY